jgi:outer membrane protein OmpA-like peptidoglycan-associated protein
MKRQPRILAGTAIGLLMASAPLGAYPLSGGPMDLSRSATPLILAQADCEGENCEQQEQAPADEQAPPPEPEAAPEPEPQAKPEPQPEPEPAPQPEPEQQAPQAEPEQAPEPEAAPQEEAPAEQPTRKERRKQREQNQQEEAPAEAAPEQDAQPEERQQRRERRQREQNQEQQEAPAQEAPAPETPAEQAPAEQQQEETPAQEQPAPEQEAPAPEQPATEQPSSDQPAEGQSPAEDEQPAQSGEQSGETPAQQREAAEPANPDAAPILDSQKQEAAPDGKRPRGERRQRRDGEQQDGQNGEQAEQQPAPVDTGPPPQTDAEAQSTIAPEQIQSVTSEQGQRIDSGRTREDRQRFREERRERHGDTKVLEQFNDNRVIFEFNNQTFIDGSDERRMIRDRDDVYYEELPRGRVREIVTRPNGVKVITVRNRYGDIVRRSRIEPDNREVILVYVEDRYYEDLEEWRDPGLDLPPMRLTIPREEYILESDYVEDEDDYYDFLEQPPVERVERTYSLNEVKRSARIRDKVRRIDMDTLTFEFGSASIAEAEIDKLEGVASAMEKLLAKNPAETFLLEGHTDAVGSDLANLALSDKRAESVAEALTNVFGIPPENLATQGYGEQYLKVNTEKRERENRRVAIRRVTPLVAPVASAN